jgi:hypothetical protein
VGSWRSGLSRDGGASPIESLVRLQLLESPREKMAARDYDADKAGNKSHKPISIPQEEQTQPTNCNNTTEH